MDIVSGTIHATPSCETLLLVIALATSRVFAMSAPGWVQPAAGRPVAAGAVPVTAVPGLDGHASVLELLLVLEQPARTARPGGPGAGLRPAATAKSPGMARTGALS